MNSRQEQQIRDRIKANEEQAEVPGFDPAQAWDKLEQKLYPPARKIPVLYRAAAAILLLLSVALAWWQLHTREQPLQLSSYRPAGKPAPPGTIEAHAPAAPATVAATKSKQPLPATPFVRAQSATLKPGPGREELPPPAPLQQETPVTATITKSAASPIADQRILRRELPQVTLSELMADEPAMAVPPRRNEARFQVGIRKIVPGLPENGETPAIAHQAIVIKF